MAKKTKDGNHIETGGGERAMSKHYIPDDDFLESLAGQEEIGEGRQKVGRYVCCILKMVPTGGDVDGCGRWL